MKNKIVAMLLAAAVAIPVAFAGGIYAQQGQKAGPCTNDRTTFCKDVRAGQGRVWMCLKSNEEKLSAECKTHMVKVKEKQKDFIKACKNDAKSFCKDIKPGEGKIVECLKENKAKLSAGCKTKFETHPADHD